MPSSGARRHEGDVMSSSRPTAVLAYSGGLDTSVILKWLQLERGYRVIAFAADLGQGAELDSARRAAESLGASEIRIEDLRETFASDYVFPMLRANALYEGVYPLGTAIARPLIAKRLVEIAESSGAEAIVHGATGKGNDQIRFELSAYALNPRIRVLSPWREWEFDGREALLSYARTHGIPTPSDAKGESPFSVDANLLHSSSEGKALEDPWVSSPEHVHTRTTSPFAAEDRSVEVTIGFECGDPVSVDGERLSGASLMERLNVLGGSHGVGRVDMVENRFVGMKSRGVYETPGGTILLSARRAVESLTLDRGASHLKDELMPRYAELIYNGLWFSPERLMLQALIDESQRRMEGEARVRLYKGGVWISGRRSESSLYDRETASFEASESDYDPSDAGGFIRVQALRLRALARRDNR